MDFKTLYSIFKIIGPIIGTGVLGFLLKILYDKKYGKKVILFHTIDKPATFSHIPPKVCFQNLRIINSGNITANNVQISLKGEYFFGTENVYKVITHEKVVEDKTQEAIILRHDKLRPKEELHIVFKTSDVLKGDFITSIKSDEVISKILATEIKSSDSDAIIAIGVIAFLIAIVFGAGYFVANISMESPAKKASIPPPPPPPPSQSKSKSDKQEHPLSAIFILNKNIYRKGEKIELTYQISNKSNESIKGIVAVIEIPGFELDYEKTYHKISYMKPKEVVTVKKYVPIDNSINNDRYKATLDISGNGLEKYYTYNAYKYFEVK